MNPLKFVGGPSSKKLVIMLEEGGAKKSGPNQPRVSPLAIKLNNFLQWSAAGCVLPYLSVYFLRYTQADSSHVGRVMSLAAVVGTIMNFVLGSLSDRYQAHRQFYLISLLLGYLSISIMFVPIFESATAIAAHENLQLESPAIRISPTTTTVTTNDTSLPAITQQQQQQQQQQLSIEDLQTIDQQQPVWFYVIGACVAFGSLSITSNQIFSDSFTASMARQCASSFGSLRFYGALGWCVSNFILSTANSYLEKVGSLSVPYLLPGWTLFALLSGCNIALIMCWPDKRPFDLSSSSPPPSHVECEGDQVDQPVVVSLGRGKPVVLVRAELLTFDALEESFAAESAIGGGQNMRRCSIAPLGDSHVVQQFEVTPRKASRVAASNGLMGEPHFKHITKVEPLENGANQLEGQIKMFQKQQQQMSERISSKPKSMGLRLHMKIIELIARRNPNLVRCMVLYSVVGFVMSANWNFLFPYLELLDASKFLTISGYVMVSTYASETVFYYFSPWVTSRVSAVNGLSAILVFLALRFSAYLAFTSSAGWPLAAWPLELMIAVEALQSVTMGWFECIFSEQALHFALEARACVPELIELGLINDTREAREQVINGVKLSLMSLSSCFFDGIGVSIGSLTGGWLVGTFSFSMLWIVCLSIALTACTINVVLELTCFRNQQPIPETTATEHDPGENKC